MQTNQPSEGPAESVKTDDPSILPSGHPISSASESPTDNPTNLPLGTPSNLPSNTPSHLPSITPSDNPTNLPSDTPSDSPMDNPTNEPLGTPSNVPSDTPSYLPSVNPSNSPRMLTTSPSNNPSKIPATFGFGVYDYNKNGYHLGVGFQYDANIPNVPIDCDDNGLNLPSYRSSSGWYAKNMITSDSNNLIAFFCKNSDWSIFNNWYQAYPFGGMFQRCRVHQVGVEPASGWTAVNNLQTGCISGDTPGCSGCCQCPAGYDEYVVSGGIANSLGLSGSPPGKCDTEIYDSGPLQFGINPTQILKTPSEIVLCFDKNKWFDGHQFGGMYSDVDNGCARNSDIHDVNGWFYITDDMYGNPLNNDKHECPVGYTKHQIGEYCCNNTPSAENCGSDKRIRHYVCLLN